MRLGYVLLVAVATLLASVNATVTISESTNRLLRSNVDGQERRLQSKMSMTQIKEIVKNDDTLSSAIKDFITVGTTEQGLAKSLGLSTNRIGMLRKIFNRNKKDQEKILKAFREAS